MRHAKTQLEGEQLAAVGGMHTSTSASNVMEQIEQGTSRNPTLNAEGIPREWLNWPCIGYFYEDALANHWEELVALGNIDNEPLNLETTWYDKLVKLRELILNHFKTEGKLKDILKQAKTRGDEGKGAKAELDFFDKGVQKCLRLKKGYFGHTRSIALKPEELFKLYIQIITRNYVDVGKKMKKKPKPVQQEGEEQVKKYMGSPNELHTFIPLPDNEATQLLSEVVNGEISLAAARKQAEVMIASSKCTTTFESAFNSFGGQKHKQRAISKGKWISYDEVVKRFPTIPQALRSWKQNFQSNKQRLTPTEKKAFESFVGTWYHSYKDSLKVGITAPVSVPLQFQLVLSNKAKEQANLQDRPWQIVQSLHGDQSAVLLINDGTENLGKYLSQNESKFGTIPYLMSIVRCCNCMCMRSVNINIHRPHTTSYTRCYP